MAGCSGVRTLGVSGNAVVDAPAALGPRPLERRIEGALARAGGLATTAFVRSPVEWRGIVRGNPFPAEARDDPAHLVVTVLTAAPAPPRWEDLRRAIVGRERAVGRGQHAYLVYPDGIGRSKLTASLIERVLGVAGTSRNWNTVLRLEEMLDEPLPGL